MASIFAHALSSVAIGSVFPKSGITRKVLMIGATSSMLPDADVIGFSFGVDYLHMWGHRGMTHSIFYAFMWAILMLLVFHKRGKHDYKIGLYYFLCTASHGVLDAMTTGGRGVAFFAPFLDDRYFLPWRFILVSPLGAGNFFSEWGIRVIQNEFIYIGIPSIILICIGYLFKKSNT